MTELRLLKDLRVVLALGRIAHEAFLRSSGLWERFTPRDRPAFSHGAEHALPGGLLLMDTFHPSRQNTQTGRLTRGMWHEVFANLRERVAAAR